MINWFKNFFSKTSNLIGTLYCAIPSTFGAVGALTNGTQLVIALSIAFGVSIIFGLIIQAFNSDTDNEGDSLFIGVGTLISMILTVFFSLFV